MSQVCADGRDPVAAKLVVEHAAPVERENVDAKAIVTKPWRKHRPLSLGPASIEVWADEQHTDTALVAHATARASRMLRYTATTR